jgi:hypothetical protein
LQEWRNLGFTSLEDFWIGFWEGLFISPKDPNDLLAMLWTWQVILSHVLSTACCPQTAKSHVHPLSGTAPVCHVLLMLGVSWNNLMDVQQGH